MKPAGMRSIFLLTALFNVEKMGGTIPTSPQKLRMNETIFGLGFGHFKG
jgi:hypothetical protein